MNVGKEVTMEIDFDLLHIAYHMAHTYPTPDVREVRRGNYCMAMDCRQFSDETAIEYVRLSGENK